MFEGTEREFVSQQSVFSRVGVDRILKFAFELAMARPKKHLTSGHQVERESSTRCRTGMNGCRDGKGIRRSAPISSTIDILCAHFVQHPDWFDVVVGSNLFGRHPERSRSGSGRLDRHCGVRQHQSGEEVSSMFEPVHGSAPTSPANSSATRSAKIWSAALMLEHLGEAAAGQAIVDAIETLLRDRRTKDA